MSEARKGRSVTGGTFTAVDKCVIAVSPSDDNNSNNNKMSGGLSVDDTKRNAANPARGIGGGGGQVSPSLKTGVDLSGISSGSKSEKPTEIG